MTDNIKSYEDFLNLPNDTIINWLERLVKDEITSKTERTESKQWIESLIDTAPATNDEKSKVKQCLEDWVNDTPTSKESKSKTKEWCMDRSIIPSSFHKWLEDWVNNPA